MGYICNEHGFKRECDVTTSGQRICYECGEAVTGVTGSNRGRRAPPSDKPSFQQGDIEWTVQTYQKRHKVMAFDHEQAIEKVADKLDTPQEINKVYPSNRNYRR